MDVVGKSSFVSVQKFAKESNSIRLENFHGEIFKVFEIHPPNKRLTLWTNCGDFTNK